MLCVCHSHRHYDNTYNDFTYDDIIIIPNAGDLIYKWLFLQLILHINEYTYNSK
jgi:hypothetical protein